MELKAGYKQTELGVIPEDWEVKCLNQIADITVGFVGSMAHLFCRNGIPLLRGQNILSNKLNLADLKYISKETHHAWGKSSLKYLDVAMVRVGYPGTSCVIPKSLGEANAASLVVVTPDKHKLDSFYLSYIINSEFGNNQIKSYLVGGAQLVLNVGTAGIFRFPLPSIKSEQEAIAKALSDADALIESLECLIAKKRQIKQGAMQELLTGTKRLPGFGELSGYKPSEIGSIPKDWKICSIGEIVIKVGSGITPTGGARIYQKEGRPFIRSQNVGWGRLILDDIVFIDEDIHASFSGTEIFTDDILLNITGASIGRCAIADNRIEGGNVNQHVCIIRVEILRLFSKFLNYFLLSAKGQKQIDAFQAGGNRQGLNFKQVRSLLIPLPPTKAEQIAIATILSDMDADLAALDTKLTKARQIKQGMMHHLLTGDIRLV